MGEETKIIFTGSNFSEEKYLEVKGDEHGNKVAKDLKTGKMPACGSISLLQADSQE